MTVSVCIPTYNSAKYLRECIASVLAQTYSDYELIVSDDGSTDGTCDIIRSFSDSRIKLHRVESHLGLVGNFNHAIGLASGKYVKLLCYDDKIEPTCLQQQVTMLEQNPSLSLVTSGMYRIDASGKAMGDVSWCKREAILRDVDVIAANLIFGNLIGVPSAVLMRREILMKVGPFSDKFPQMTDVELYLRLIEQGQVGYVPECLCSWRLHPESATTLYRKTGIVRNDMRTLTEAMLQSVSPTWAARRVAWGRVSGSFLAQAALGLRYGHLKWPLVAAAQAFRIDPFFFSLAAFVSLFRTGVLGLAADDHRRLHIQSGRTLGDLA